MSTASLTTMSISHRAAERLAGLTCPSVEEPMRQIIGEIIYDWRPVSAVTVDPVVTLYGTPGSVLTDQAARLLAGTSEALYLHDRLLAATDVGRDREVQWVISLGVEVARYREPNGNGSLAAHATLHRAESIEACPIDRSYAIPGSYATEDDAEDIQDSLLLIAREVMAGGGWEIEKNLMVANERLEVAREKYKQSQEIQS